MNARRLICANLGLDGGTQVASRSDVRLLQGWIAAMAVSLGACGGTSAGDAGGARGTGDSGSAHDAGAPDPGAPTRCGSATSFSRSFGGTGHDRATGVAIDAEGGIVLAGTFEEAVDFGVDRLVAAGEFDLFLAVLDGAGNPVKSDRVGSPGYEYGGPVAVGENGDRALTAGLTAPLDLGSGPVGRPGAELVAVYDGEGRLRWARAFEDVNVGAVALRDGKLLLTGRVEGEVDLGAGLLKPVGDADGFVAEIAEDGRALWSRTLPDAGDGGVHDAVLTPEGGLVIAGTFSGQLDVAPLPTLDGSGGFVAELGANGEGRWVRLLSAQANVYAVRAARGADGTVGVIGNVGGPVPHTGGVVVAAFEADGAPRYNHSLAVGTGDYHEATDVAVTLGGGVLVTGVFDGLLKIGTRSRSSAGKNDVFLVRLSRSGELADFETFGDEQEQTVPHLAVSPDGVLVVAGAFSGSFEIFDCRLSSTGSNPSFYDVFVAARPL